MGLFGDKYVAANAIFTWRYTKISGGMNLKVSIELSDRFPSS